MLIKKFERPGVIKVTLQYLFTLSAVNIVPHFDTILND